MIPTTIRIIDQNSRLIAGITAKAKFELNKAENVWTVPFASVIQKPDGTMAIAAVENNVVKMIPVKNGVESDIQTEIIPEEEGALKEGMQVIDAPTELLEDGTTVVVAPSGQ